MNKITKDMKRGRPCFTNDCVCQNYYILEKEVECINCGTKRKNLDWI